MKLRLLPRLACVPALLAACLLAGCGAPAKSEAAKPTKAAVSGSYAFWPQFPEEPRIQFLRSLASSEDVAPTTTSGLDKIVFGAQSNRAESVNKPYGAAMRDGKIYICDIRDSCLTVLDLRKKQTRLVGMTGSMPLKRPVAVAVDESGQIFVADNERGSIVVFDAAERYSRVMGHPKLKPGALAARAGRLYVSDLASQLVEVYDCKTGNQIGTIGAVGDEDGQFRLPLGVAIDPKGDIYVVDMMRCKVQKFSPEGKFLSAFGSLGDFPGAFVRPKHISIDSEGIIYVVDAAFQNVQLFDSQHRLLMHFGAAGSFPGAMNLPAGVAVCDDSLDLFASLLHPGFKPRRVVVVTNQFGEAKVSLYALGSLREGYTARDLAAAATKVESGLGEGAKGIVQPPPGSAAPGDEGAPPQPGQVPAAQPAQPGAAPQPATAPETPKAPDSPR